MRQSKQERRCPNCGGALKKTIGAQSRKKFWECADRGVGCFRKECSEMSTESVTLDIKWDTKHVQA